MFDPFVTNVRRCPNAKNCDLIYEDPALLSYLQTDDPNGPS
jgi:hypothetical protein